MKATDYRHDDNEISGVPETVKTCLQYGMVFYDEVDTHLSTDVKSCTNDSLNDVVHNRNMIVSNDNRL